MRAHPSTLRPAPLPLLLAGLLPMFAACGASDGSPAAAPPPPATSPGPAPAPTPTPTLGPPPHVTAMNVRGSPPAGGGLLLIKGTGLQPGVEVSFGGVTAVQDSFTPGTPGVDDQLVVTIPPSPLLPAMEDGFVDVVVRNLDGQLDRSAPPVSADGTSWPANFHYGPPPRVTGFTPGTGKGVDVTITGTGFSSDATGARAGLQVLMSGPSAPAITIHRCPDAADPSCAPGLVSPTPTSLLITVPANRINPGDYVLVVTDFDAQYTLAPGLFVVP